MKLLALVARAMNPANWTPGGDNRCPRCGQPVDIDWCEITTLGDPLPRHVPGQARCPTPGCGTTCPICRRPPGDIHSGACAPIILGKLVDQVRVTVEDCRWPAAEKARAA